MEVPLAQRIFRLAAAYPRIHVSGVRCIWGKYIIGDSLCQICQSTQIAIIIIFLIAIGLIAFLKLYPLNPASPSARIEAKITAFTLDSGWQSPLAGLAMYSYFNVTVANTGDLDISGLYLSVKSYNDTQNYHFSYNNQDFTLNKSETTSLRVDMTTLLDVYNNLSNQNFLVTLASNGTVLDERSLLDNK